MGNVNLDFGDSPETAGGHYPTELGLNGAVHMITEPPLYLGQRVDAERDGQVSANVDGDDNDSNGFASQYVRHGARHDQRPADAAPSCSCRNR